MPSPLRQTSFASGELSPSRWGRTDLPEYATGLRRLYNLFVSRHGEAVSRPGTKWVWFTKYSGAPNDNVRLIPFIFSDEETYVLEFGAGYIRFYQDGNRVFGSKVPVSVVSTPFLLGQGDVVTGGTSGATGIINDEDGSFLYLSSVVGTFVSGETITGATSGSATTSGPSVPTHLQLTTGYSADQVKTLQYIQSGDVLTLTHPDSQPAVLKRWSATKWTFSDFNFQRKYAQYREAEPPYAITYTPMAVGWRHSAEYRVGQAVINPNNGDTFECTTAGTSAATGAGPAGTGTGITDGTATWQYGSDSTRPFVEWRWQTTVIAQDSVTGITYESAAQPITLVEAGAMPSRVVLFPDRPIQFIQVVSGLTAAFTEDKIVAVNYYRGRGKLYGLVGTTTADYFVDTGGPPDYSRQPPLSRNVFEVRDKDDNLMRTENPIALAYFQERLCFGGTSQRPGYLFMSAVGDYIDFDEDIQPTPASAIIFDLFSRRREDIRCFIDAGRLLIFTSSTVRSMSGHQGQALEADVPPDVRLVEEIGSKALQPLVVDGCALYARTKGSGVRALVPNGGISGFQGADVSIHSQHLLQGSERSSTQYDDLTSFTIIDWCYQEDPWGIVWAVRDDGMLLSLTLDVQHQTYAWAQHETDGKVFSICSVPEGNEDAVYVAVMRTVGGVPKSSVERMNSRIRRNSPTDDMALDCIVTAIVPPETTRILGLDALEGRVVYAICYGNSPQGPYTVTGGAIDLAATFEATFTTGGTPVLWIHVGLPFTAELETLDVVSTDSRGRKKKVTDILVEVGETFELKAGQDFDHLDAWNRTVDGGVVTPSAASMLVRIPVKGAYDTGARGCIRQSSPFPLTVLGITRLVDMGEN